VPPVGFLPLIRGTICLRNRALPVSEQYQVEKVADYPTLSPSFHPKSIAAGALNKLLLPKVRLGRMGRMQSWFNQIDRLWHKLGSVTIQRESLPWVILRCSSLAMSRAKIGQISSQPVQLPDHKRHRRPFTASLLSRSLSQRSKQFKEAECRLPANP
jgi:hypothetical protein